MIYCQNVSYLREISQFMGRTYTYLPIYPKNERIGTGDRGDRKKLPREGRTGRWVTSGATSINKGVENAQLEPWPPRDRRATGSRINVNSFAMVVAHASRSYARDAAFIARLAVYCFFYEDCSPLNHEQAREPPELLLPGAHPSWSVFALSVRPSRPPLCTNTSTSSYSSFVNRIRPIGRISVEGDFSLSRQTMLFVETHVPANRFSFNGVISMYSGLYYYYFLSITCNNTFIFRLFGAFVTRLILSRIVFRDCKS